MIVAPNWKRIRNIVNSTGLNIFQGLVVSKRFSSFQLSQNVCRNFAFCTPERPLDLLGCVASRTHKMREMLSTAVVIYYPTLLAIENLLFAFFA